MRWFFWAGEGEEGRGNGFPVSPRSDPRPGTHTAHTFSPTTRRRRHSRVSARLPLPHCGARRQTAEEQRAPLLVCPTPPLRRSSRRGVEAGLGTGASKRNHPFHNLPPRRTAPLACGLFNHSPEKKKKATLNQTCCWVTTAPFAFPIDTRAKRSTVQSCLLVSCGFFSRALLVSAAREKEIDCRVHMGSKETRGRGVCGFFGREWRGV